MTRLQQTLSFSSWVMMLKSFLLLLLLSLQVSSATRLSFCCSDADCGSAMECNRIPAACDKTTQNSGSCGLRGGACFSKDMALHVKGKGPTRMQDLKVGDVVRTSHDLLEPIYAFGHYVKESSTQYSYVEISYMTPPLQGETAAPLSSLKVTPDHLIHLASGRFVAADQLEIGDALHGNTAADGDWVITVTGIQHVQEAAGLYAPLTPSGKLLVNDRVETSCYISFQEGRPEDFILTTDHRHNQQDGNDNVALRVLSQHWFVHLGLSPIRMLCLGISPRLCHNDWSIVLDDNIDIDNQRDGPNGYAWFTNVAFAMVEFLEHQCLAVQVVLMAIYLVVFGSCFIVEWVVGPYYAPSLTVVGLLLTVGWRGHFRNQATNYETKA